MPKVTIKRHDITVEAEVSFEQLKELIGVNGHKSATNPEQPQLFEVKTPEPRKRQRSSAKRPIKHGDFNAFLRSLSERAKKFLETVSKHPDGIPADELAPLLGFNTANQIGGLTGPGIVKIAKAFGFEAEDIYNSPVTFPGGQRKRVFFPGKLLKDWSAEREKPA